MFRKTIVNNRNSGFGFSSSISELKTVPRGTSPGVNSFVVEKVSLSDLSKETLPIMSLDDVIESGSFLSGNVDFTPTDPANLIGIQEVVGDYLDTVIQNTTSSSVVSSDSVSSDD